MGLQYKGQKNMKSIAIIGAGQLGSRHLQGLAKSNIRISIEIVDPLVNSRSTAEQRIQEMPKNKNVDQISYYENISQLSKNLDFVIVATNADVRHEVVGELLENKNIKYLVLEKVLFQRIEEYFKVAKLLKSKNTICWVNHTRRMFPLYQRLKEKFSKTSSINFSVSGGAWGLGCNGLHFLDCMQYLTGSNDIFFNTKFLHKALYNSKRSGFKELNGLPTGRIAKHTFCINCFAEEQSPVQFNITSSDVNILIDEANGWFRISEKNNNWENEIKEEKIVYFQSELTNILVENVFSNNCDLPKYKEAMNLHIQYLKVLLEHINSFSESEYNFCPIT